MAEPIRNFTPKRDALHDMRDKLEALPREHAKAIFAGYRLLQAAHDHGVLDLLTGAIGGGEAIVAKVSEYGNTPEGIRALRNLLLAMRLLGQIEPALLESVENAIQQDRERRQQCVRAPGPLELVRLLTGENARRALASIAGMLNAFGSTRHSDGAEQAGRSRGSLVTAAAASALGVAVAGFLIGRMSATSAE